MSEWYPIHSIRVPSKYESILHRSTLRAEEQMLFAPLGGTSSTVNTALIISNFAPKWKHFFAKILGLKWSTFLYYAWWSPEPSRAWSLSLYNRQTRLSPHWSSHFSNQKIRSQ